MLCDFVLMHIRCRSVTCNSNRKDRPFGADFFVWMPDSPGMQFFGIVPVIFLRVRAHDWFSELFDRNGDFSRLGRSHMAAGLFGLEPMVGIAL